MILGHGNQASLDVRTQEDGDWNASGSPNTSNSIAGEQK